MSEIPEDIAAKARESDLAQRANEWIVGDDTGASSQALWAKMMGVNRRDPWGSYPLDPADIGRCFRLLERIPEWRPRLSEMSAVSKHWARLVNRWDEIRAMMDGEVGIDWSKGRRAGLTYKLMKQVLGDDEAV